MNKQIAIIGAGVSGLIAALQLETYGYKPIIFETDNRVGGRVQSDVIDGYILDRGFQVLLNAYPLAKKYLDYEKLNLKAFAPGSYIFGRDKLLTVGDPIRDFSFLWSTLFSKIGSFSDKLKVYRLTKELREKPIEVIFKEKEISTIDYLKNYGFSLRIIDTFFEPFFAGIFLETDLNTSSRMFEFVFKMFSSGEAAIPAKGMQEIPNQLASKLTRTEFYFGKKVKTIYNNEIIFEDDSKFVFEYCVVATEASDIISNLKGSRVSWKSAYNLYFEVAQKDAFKKPIIGLLANCPNALINSVCFPYTENTKNKLLSVSVVKATPLQEDELVQIVKDELNNFFNIKPLKYLKTYYIKKSLPNLSNIQYKIHPSETQLTESIFLAGDTLLNGSLNAAMFAGELAAQAVHEKITGTILN